MLDTIDRSTIDDLIDREAAPCVTVLMPTERAGPETRQGPIRLRNLLDEARHRLVDVGIRAPDADSLLEQVEELTNDRSFWQHQEDGLAIHVAADFTRTTRLAIPLDELVVVSDGFHVKPLLHEVEGDDRFYLLALSRGEVRLLWGRRHRVGEIAIDGVIPDGLAEALWFEDREKQLQHRAASRSGRGSVVATFHGHGSPDEGDEERDRAFLRAVDRGVMELVDPDVPLVLAGVTEITASFRAVTSHPRVLDGAVEGNPDHLSAEELHSAAWEIAEPVVTAGRNVDVERFEESPSLRLTDAAETLTAALNGRVDAVWVSLGRRLWGSVGSDGSIERHHDRRPGDRDLTDTAAIEVRRHGGRVHVVDPADVPGGGPLAAVARYSID